MQFIVATVPVCPGNETPWGPIYKISYNSLTIVTVGALSSLVGPAHQLLLPLAAFKCDVF